MNGPICLHLFTLSYHPSSSGHDGDKFNEDDDATAINKMKAANSEHGDSKNQERKNVSTPFSLIKDEKRKDEQLEDKMIPVEKFKASPKLGMDKRVTDNDNQAWAVGV